MHKSTVLIVDDEPTNLALLTTLLRSNHTVRAANSGQHALGAALTEPIPDLILLDIMMPEIDGYQVLKHLKANARSADIPVIFLSALADDLDEERGLELGAVDYLTKPIKPLVLQARVRTQLENKRARDLLAQQNELLEQEVKLRMAENDRTQRVSIRALAHLAEARDPETGYHILRTQGYVELLGRLLQSHPRFSDTLTTQYIDLLSCSAPLHDIGKVGIPDHILLKPGKLTAEEWAIMQTHTTYGSDALHRAEHDVAQPLDFLSTAKEITRWHHERWDGSGYPDGLAGDAIPLSARLMAVADVFDALISPRVYKVAFSFEEARRLIEESSGSHFDADIVNIFLQHFSAFADIALRYHDDQP